MSNTNFPTLGNFTDYALPPGAAFLTVVNDFQSLLKGDFSAANREKTVKSFADKFSHLTPDQKVEVAKQAKAYIASRKDLLTNVTKSTFDQGAFAFQTVIYAIENNTGKTPTDSFPKFSSYHGVDGYHPDGRFGPLTNSVYLGKEYLGKGQYADATPNAFLKLASGDKSILTATTNVAPTIIKSEKKENTKTTAKTDAFQPLEGGNIEGAHADKKAIKPEAPKVTTAKPEAKVADAKTPAVNAQTKVVATDKPVKTEAKTAETKTPAANTQTKVAAANTPVKAEAKPTEVKTPVANAQATAPAKVTPAPAKTDTHTDVKVAATAKPTIAPKTDIKTNVADSLSRQGVLVTPTDFAANYKASQAAKPKTEASKDHNATAQDVKDLTLTRAPVQYARALAKEYVPTAQHINMDSKGDSKPLTAEQLQGIAAAVREYAFDEKGKLIDRAFEKGHPSGQLLTKIAEKTNIPLSDLKLANITFDAKTISTRSIVGSFNAAEAAVNKQEAKLIDQGKVVKDYLVANQAYLEKNGVKVSKIDDLTAPNRDEETRGVYFKANYLPPLNKLVEKEKADITAKYKPQIDAENAKMGEFDARIAIASLGYPTQKTVKTDNVTMKDGYDENGVAKQVAKHNITEKLVPQTELLKPIDVTAPEWQTPAAKAALVASKLATQDEKGNLTFVSVGSVTAKEALKNPKEHYNEIRAVLEGVKDPKKNSYSGGAYELTAEENQKKSDLGNSNMDLDIIKEKIQGLRKTKQGEVDKKVGELVSQRDTEIANGTAHKVHADATRTLGNFQQALVPYQDAATFEVARQLAECTGGKVTHAEKVVLDKLADKVESKYKKDLAIANANVDDLEKQLKTAPVDQKDALTQRIATAKADIATMPQKFEQHDDVTMIQVKQGGTILMTVDGATKKTLKAATPAQAAAPTPQPEGGKKPFALNIDDANVKAALDNFRTHATNFVAAADAEKTAPANGTAKDAADKNLKDALKALQEDGKTIRSLQKVDKAENSPLDQNIEDTAKALAANGLIFKDEKSVEIDAQKTIASFKPKPAAIQK